MGSRLLRHIGVKLASQKGNWLESTFWADRPKGLLPDARNSVPLLTLLFLIYPEAGRRDGPD